MNYLQFFKKFKSFVEKLKLTASNRESGEKKTSRYLLLQSVIIHLCCVIASTTIHFAIIEERILKIWDLTFNPADLTIALKSDEGTLHG